MDSEDLKHANRKAQQLVQKFMNEEHLRQEYSLTDFAEDCVLGVLQEWMKNQMDVDPYDYDELQGEL